ncbi:RagB/SusD family nutrient uptake outer membrane protein [Cellulophaga sp. F20128]|uniref:RagB/SusD family nutrient uptake outer membrane protein n=1 Tax=Cellulophaga sp. F20128 TaxID=2926413 RepID=UPI001FF659D0|nr:RagB/SusD family nutrient uptake outer membrane protein [Cellulophaga sp. F20128]MCK0157296.1 RagB/SusD family nutrient uptake outer membrane protein [Cellulophaga sp. F20128]
MNIKVKIGLLLITVMSISCEEYLLEEPPTFISASNYWQTASDARTAVNGVYQKLNDVHNRFWPVVDAYTDDQVSRTQGGFHNAFGTHTVTPSHQMFEQFGIYSEWWIGIGRANNVLKFVPGIDMDETEKNVILGEARALRAFYYYQLVRAYGDVPLIVDAVTTEADFQKPRASVETIYDEIIIPDLQFAENNCTDGLHDGHITKWTAKLILSEVYLTRAGHRRTSQGDFIQGDASNWALARDKAKEVIDDAPNSLNLEGKTNGANSTPAYGMAWDDNNPFTKESMLELSYVQVLGLGNWLSRESNGTGTATGYWGINPNATPLTAEGWPGDLRRETDANPDGLFFKGGPPGVGVQLPTPDLYDAFEDGDERRDFSVMTRYETPSGRPYLCQPTFRKFIDISYYTGEEGTSFQYTNSNIVLYRFADALLIYAEAQNEADGAPNAASYTAVNALRNRAGLDNLTAGLSQPDFRAAVWQERRVELNAEFKRKFDLIRTNRLVTETTNINLDWTADQGSLSDYVNCYTPFYNDRPQWPDNEWLFPIPQSEIDLNIDNGWMQNEGY